MIERRYFSLSRYFHEKYGEPVYKISLDAGFTCPNRENSASGGGCVYCENGGSRYGAGSVRPDIKKQLTDEIERLSGRAQKYIAYFQAFTNSYAPAEKLKLLYDEALSHPGVVGLAIGTRPDCLPPEVLDLLSEYNENGCELWVELGLQTVHDKTLARINRGHTYKNFLDSLAELNGRGIAVCVHLIFGLPGEGKKEMEATIDEACRMDIQGIKLHQLHFVGGTALEKMHRDGEVEILSRDEYTGLVCDTIERLREEVVIHRLMGDADFRKLTTPKWSMQKAVFLYGVDKELEKRGSRQGSKYKNRKGFEGSRVQGSKGSRKNKTCAVPSPTLEPSNP